MLVSLMKTFEYQRLLKISSPSLNYTPESRIEKREAISISIQTSEPTARKELEKASLRENEVSFSTKLSEVSGSEESYRFTNHGKSSHLFKTSLYTDTKNSGFSISKSIFTENQLKASTYKGLHLPIAVLPSSRNEPFSNIKQVAQTKSIHSLPTTIRVRAENPDLASHSQNKLSKLLSKDGYQDMRSPSRIILTKSVTMVPSLQATIGTLDKVKPSSLSTPDRKHETFVSDPSKSVERSTVNFTQALSSIEGNVEKKFLATIISSVLTSIKQSIIDGSLGIAMNRTFSVSGKAETLTAAMEMFSVTPRVTAMTLRSRSTAASTASMTASMPEIVQLPTDRGLTYSTVRAVSLFTASMGDGAVQYNTKDAAGVITSSFGSGFSTLSVPFDKTSLTTTGGPRGRNSDTFQMSFTHKSGTSSQKDTLVEAKTSLLGNLQGSTLLPRRSSFSDGRVSFFSSAEVMSNTLQEEVSGSLTASFVSKGDNSGAIISSSAYKYEDIDTIYHSEKTIVESYSGVQTRVKKSFQSPILLSTKKKQSSKLSKIITKHRADFSTVTSERWSAKQERQNLSAYTQLLSTPFSRKSFQHNSITNTSKMDSTLISRTSSSFLTKLKTVLTSILTLDAMKSSSIFSIASKVTNDENIQTVSHATNESGNKAFISLKTARLSSESTINERGSTKKTEYVLFPPSSHATSSFAIQQLNDISKSTIVMKAESPSFLQITSSPVNHSVSETSNSFHHPGFLKNATDWNQSLAQSKAFASFSEGFATSSFSKRGVFRIESLEQTELLTSIPLFPATAKDSKKVEQSLPTSSFSRKDLPPSMSFTTARHTSGSFNQLRTDESLPATMPLVVTASQQEITGLSSLLITDAMDPSINSLDIDVSMHKKMSSLSGISSTDIFIPFTMETNQNESSYASIQHQSFRKSFEASKSSLIESEVWLKTIYTAEMTSNYTQVLTSMFRSSLTDSAITSKRAFTPASFIEENYGVTLSRNSSSNDYPVTNFKKAPSIFSSYEKLDGPSRPSDYIHQSGDALPASSRVQQSHFSRKWKESDLSLNIIPSSYGFRPSEIKPSMFPESVLLSDSDLIPSVPILSSARSTLTDRVQESSIDTFFLPTYIFKETSMVLQISLSILPKTKVALATFKASDSKANGYSSQPNNFVPDFVTTSYNVSPLHESAPTKSFGHHHVSNISYETDSTKAFHGITKPWPSDKITEQKSRSASANILLSLSGSVSKKFTSSALSSLQADFRDTTSTSRNGRSFKMSPTSLAFASLSSNAKIENSEKSSLMTIPVPTFAVNQSDSNSSFSFSPQPSGNSSNVQSQDFAHKTSSLHGTALRTAYISPIQLVTRTIEMATGLYTSKSVSFYQTRINVVQFSAVASLTVSNTYVSDNDYTKARIRGTGASSFQPSSFQPSSFQPSSFQPSSFQPSSFQPSSFQPSSFQPSSFQPSSFQPSSFQPSSFQPSSFQPSSFQPSSFQPSSFQPSSFQPSSFQPSSFQPSSFQPSSFQPSSFQPSSFQPSSFQPSSFQTSSILFHSVKSLHPLLASSASKDLNTANFKTINLIGRSHLESSATTNLTTKKNLIGRSQVESNVTTILMTKNSIGRSQVKSSANTISKETNSIGRSQVESSAITNLTTPNLIGKSHLESSAITILKTTNSIGRSPVKSSATMNIKTSNVVGRSYFESRTITNLTTMVSNSGASSHQISSIRVVKSFHFKRTNAHFGSLSTISSFSRIPYASSSVIVSPSHATTFNTGENSTNITSFSQINSNRASTINTMLANSSIMRVGQPLSFSTTGNSVRSQSTMLPTVIPPNVKGLAYVPLEVPVAKDVTTEAYKQNLELYLISTYNMLLRKRRKRAVSLKQNTATVMFKRFSQIPLLRFHFCF